MAPASRLLRAPMGLYVIYGVVFVAFFDNHSLLPIMAPYARSLGASVGLVGMIMGAYSLVNLMGNVGAGYFIDRLGRKPLVLLGLGAAGLAILLYAFVRTPSQLLGLRFLHGLGAAMVAPASLAYISDLSHPEKRGETLAFYGATIGLTVLLGPPLAGLLRDLFGYDQVFYFIAALIFFALIPAALWVQESLPPEERAGSPFPLMRRRKLWAAYGSAFALMFSLGLLIVLLPLQAQDLGFSSAQTGLLFSSFALAAILIQVAPTRRLSDRLGRRDPMVLGLVLIAIAVFALAGLERWEWILAAMFLYGVGFGALFPAMTALLSDQAQPAERGTVSGLFMAVYSFGVIVGTTSTGLLVRVQELWSIHPFQTTATVALLGALATWVLLAGRRAEPQEEQPRERSADPRAWTLKPAQHQIPRRSFLYDRVLPALILSMGLVMVILILVAAGVLLGLVPFP